jgi:sigma-B regulation protein RsbU (phosphoserine phosphatase)
MRTSLKEHIEKQKDMDRIESELDFAKDIQLGFLPMTEEEENSGDDLHELTPFLRPAKEVGGDLYDFFKLDDGRLCVIVGDVSGKGVAASLVMAITRVMLRFVVGMGLPLDETLYRLNNSFSESNEMGMFVTLFVARLDLKTGHMDYCNAGHNPILIIPPDGEPYFLHCKANIAIGLIGDFAYEAEQIDLKHGTRLVAYTDGVTEAEKADQSQFGEDRLMAWAKELTPLNSGLVEGSKDRTVEQDTSDSNTEIAVVESLYDSVKAFTDGNSQNDDITIVSLKL